MNSLYPALPNPLCCVKAYDIRGKLGHELNVDIAYRLGRAIALWVQQNEPNDTPQTVVVGADVRPSSAGLKQALVTGLQDGGLDVIDLGVTGTEEVYFATFYLAIAAGIEVTASHNPLDYNGMKIIGRGATPLCPEHALKRIEEWARLGHFVPSKRRGQVQHQDLLQPYVQHLLGFVRRKDVPATTNSLNPGASSATKIVSRSGPLRLLVNSGNGPAGRVIDEIERQLKQLNDVHLPPLQFVKIQHEADGTFPNGIANPLLPERRSATIEAVLEHGVDMGVAFDGDFDRCFFFDERGRFIEGYYIVGLLAAAFLQQQPSQRIVHDPRLTWNTVQTVLNHGGWPVQSRTGHAFIKQQMRDSDAVYGGEMSAHHYFRDFAYCDSGMIPWLLVAQLLGQTGRSLSELVDEAIAAFPCSGELNFTVSDPAAVIARVQQRVIKDQTEYELDVTDGVSVAFSQWRFNLRASNTEPLLRLNVETRADPALLINKVADLTAWIQQANEAVSEH